MGGFLARNYIFVGDGSGNWQHALDICAGCAKALIRAGWRLDTSVCSDISDIKTYDGGGDAKSCWYVLKSKTKNAKLLVYYNYRTRTVPSAQTVPFDGGTPYEFATSGLCMSMIPDGSLSEFGSSPASESPHFIPDDATFLYSDRYTYYSDSVNSEAYANDNNVKYEWVFLTNAEDVVFCYKIVDGNNRYSYAIGKLIGTLSYPENDTSTQSKYCGIGLAERAESGNTNLKYIRLASAVDNNTHWSGNYCGASIFKANGERLPFPTSEYGARVDIFTDFNLFNNYLSSSYLSGLRRWSPLGIGVFSPNPSTEPTVFNGDGFKGYLDTNIFRAVSWTDIQREQLLNDGNFLYVVNGIAVAWDPSNILKLTYQNTSIDTRNYDGGTDPFA